MKEQLKQEYMNAWNEFMPLREKEEDSETLTEQESERYVFLVDEKLLPLSKQLMELGENDFLNYYSFTYEY